MTGPAWWLTWSSWPSSGRPRVASQRAVFSAFSSSTETDQIPASRTVSWKRAIFSAQNSTSTGSRDTALNALTVMAWSTPSRRVPTTRMPVGRRPAA